MTINRHNYEEYFTLYLDNELNSDDRRMVEAFTQQHPDLKEELDLLTQYKLTPDTSIVFPGKEELMKVNDDTPVTFSNYEEWLVLYIDNELNPGQKDSVEQFIKANPSVKEEMALLMKAKLEPEEIVFANKGSLYRREEKVRSLPVRWWRIAAAAVLIFALGITALLVFNNKTASVKTDIAKSPNSNNKKTTPANITDPMKENSLVIVPEQSNKNNHTKQSVTPVVKQDNKNIAVKSNKPVVNDKLPSNVPIQLKKQEEAVVKNIENKPSNNLPQPLNNPNIKKSDAANDVIANVNIPKETVTPSDALTEKLVTNVIPASYNSNDGAADQMEEGGKNKKNRGLFRKLARTFEKRTNINATDDGKLLIGGLAIKLK